MIIILESRVVVISHRNHSSSRRLQETRNANIYSNFKNVLNSFAIGPRLAYTSTMMITIIRDSRLRQFFPGVEGYGPDRRECTFVSCAPPRRREAFDEGPVVAQIRRRRTRPAWAWPWPWGDRVAAGNLLGRQRIRWPRNGADPRIRTSG